MTSFELFGEEDINITIEFDYWLAHLQWIDDIYSWMN